MPFFLKDPVYSIFRKEKKHFPPGGLPLPMCPIYKVSKLITESFAPHIAAGKTYFAHIYPNPLVWKHKENDHQILFMVTKCRDKYFCIHWILCSRRFYETLRYTLNWSPLCPCEKNSLDRTNIKEKNYYNKCKEA